MTLNCPACNATAELSREPSCRTCGWTPKRDDGVVMLMTDEDRARPIFGSYLDAYDRIATGDLKTPILDLGYVERQADNLARAAGNVADLDVLDLGCGQGFLTRALVAKGARSVAAIDISTAYLKRLAGLPGITPIMANAERLPFKQAFDLLVSTDVMEHVLNMGSFLVSVNDALRLGGRAIIRVPYRENLIGYASQAGCNYEFVHLRAFNRRLLHETLKGAGFAIEQTSLDGFSVYSPQPFWIAGARRKAAYIKWQNWLMARVTHPAVVTTWPWRLASLVMRPAEIVVVARKTGPALAQDAA